MNSDEDTDSLSWTSAVGSLTSTANDLVLEHGRRFPNYRYGSSPFPRGDVLAEQHEISLHNMLFTVFDDRLHTIPGCHPRNVLDIRCGQHGLWAKAIADSYPETQVTGFDILPPPDTEGRENLQFELQSFSDDVWILDDVIQQHGKFDLVYARAIFGSSQDYPQVYRQCFDNLAPGGYLQQIELDPYPSCDDGTMPDSSMIKQMSDLIPMLERPFNTDYHLARNMVSLIEGAGFVDIKQQSFYAPLSPWHPQGTKEHEIGQYAQRFYETGLQGWILAPLVKHYDFTPEQIDKVCEATIIQLRRNEQHIYTTVHTVSARKPADL